MPTFLYIPAASSSAWTPDDLTDLFFWFDSDAITGKSDGDALTTLSDSSGNSRNLTGTGATYETNEIDGKAVARLDGDLFSSGTVNASGSKVGCWAVIKRNTSTLGSHFCAFGSHTVVEVFLLGSGGDKVPRFIVWNSSGTRIVDESPGAALSTTDATILGFRADVNAGTYQSRRNGSTVTNSTGLTPTTSTLNTGNTSINTGFAGSNAQGDVAEIVVVMGEVSDDNRDKIEGYLAHKWGLEGNLPSGHAYKNSAP